MQSTDHFRTRAEHIRWAKARALAELDGSAQRDSPGHHAARVSNVINSFGSDLTKHPETAYLADWWMQLAMREWLANHAAPSEARIRQLVEDVAE